MSTAWTAAAVSKTQADTARMVDGWAGLRERAAKGWRRGCLRLLGGRVISVEFFLSSFLLPSTVQCLILLRNTVDTIIP
jgi:hypothetical protein